MVNFSIFAQKPKAAHEQKKDIKTGITLQEVSEHNQANDCWIVIYDRIYDITKFLDEHPGGRELLLEHAGFDATLAFLSAGHGQSTISILSPYHIGNLPANECLFPKK